MKGAPFPVGVLAEELVVELALEVRVSLFEDEFELVGVGVGVGELFADELLLEVVVGEDVFELEVEVSDDDAELDEDEEGDGEGVGVGEGVGAGSRVSQVTK